MLTSCDRLATGNPNICSAPKGLIDATIEHDKRAPKASPQERLGLDNDLMDNCLHAMAYRIAGAPDGAKTVADAVVGSCKGHFLAIALDGPSLGTPFEQAMQDAKADAADTALYYVLAARAGHCPAPP